MALDAIDWLIVVSFFVVALTIGVAVAKRAGRSSSEFFLSGRHMPWWLLGVSMGQLNGTGLIFVSLDD